MGHRTNITIERTRNLALVRSILTHPRLWRAAADDGTGDPSTWQPHPNPAICYLLAYDWAELLGLFAFVPQSVCCYEAHVGLLPEAWGWRSPWAACAAFRWMWENTPARRITASIPVSNRLAVRLATRAGMTVYGTNTASFLRDGRLLDQVLLGISKDIP